jgi:hypothetical protein
MKVLTFASRISDVNTDSYSIRLWSCIRRALQTGTRTLAARADVNQVYSAVCFRPAKYGIQRATCAYA